MDNAPSTTTPGIVPGVWLFVYACTNHRSEKPEFAGADSRELLRRVLADGHLAGWQLVNLDCTVVAQKPRLAPYIPLIRNSIAELFGVVPERISVKAKTNEGLDAVGHGEAIAAQAVILIRNS